MSTQRQDTMNSDTEKPTVSQAENLPNNVYEKPPVRRRVARHCLRFWWAHLIAFICIVVLVVCLVIFVAIPKIAQNTIDNATLTVEGITATQTQSDNLTMAINSTVYSNSKYSATVAPFQGVMYLEDLQPHTPFLTLDFPQTTSDPVQVVNVTQFITITDLDAFTTFNTWLLWNDSVRVTLAGDTYVQVKGLSKKFGVTFSKTVTIPGLRGFAGFNVTQSNVSLTHDANGDNFEGFVTVPNYSIVAFDIGNASFTSYLNGEAIGTVYLDNTFLRPGMNNNFSMHANISQASITTALGQSPYCTNGGELPFTMNGKAVVNNGQLLSYYAGALGAGNFTTVVDIGGDLKREYNLTVPCSGS